MEGLELVEAGCWLLYVGGEAFGAFFARRRGEFYRETGKSAPAAGGRPAPAAALFELLVPADRSLDLELESWGRLGQGRRGRLEAAGRGRGDVHAAAPPRGAAGAGLVGRWGGFFASFFLFM